LQDATWGERNRLALEHPFAKLMPAIIVPWLSAPAEPLPGDVHMPRVQSPTKGASERFVVSPGRETQGILEMPGGASGHLMSPFFLAGHQDWVKGAASPFLPGEQVHVLELTP
jgi:penicillin amidase